MGIDLRGFHRAKVMDVNDTQMVGYIGVYLTELMNGIDDSLKDDIDYFEKNKDVNMIIAKPIFHYDEGISSEKYDTVAGNFRMPNKGSYVIVFFLNNDYSNCYYLPNMTLPYTNQSISGENLDLEDKFDFYNIERKHKVMLEQYYNRTITGFNSNEDVNKFFINFDNGASISFASPNEESSVDSIKKSNLTKPTELNLNVKRFDSQYKSNLNILTTNENSILTTSVKKKPNDIKHGSDYINNDINPEYFNTKTKLFVDRDSTGYKAYSEYKLDDNTYSNSSMTVSSNNESSEITESGEMSYGDSNSSYNSGVNIGKTSITSYLESTFKHDVKTDKIVNLSNKSKLSDGLFNKIFELINKLSKNVFLTIKKITEITTTSYKKNNFITINDTTYNSELQTKLTYKENVDKNSARINQYNYMTYATDINSRYETTFVNNVDINSNHFEYSSTDTDFDNINKSGIFRKVVMGNITEEYAENYKKITYKTKNPADVTGSLGLDPLKEKGHKIWTKVDEGGNVKTVVESVKEVFKGDPSVVMGHPSKVEIEDDAFNTNIKVRLGGLMGKDLVKIDITSDKNGSVKIEVPKGDVSVITTTGDINLKSKSGDINMEAMNINMKAKNKIKLDSKATIDVKTKITNINSSASFKVNTKSLILKGVIIETKGSVFKSSSKSIFLGSNAVNGIAKGPLIYSWAISHTHVVPGAGVSNVALPMLSFNSISKNVMVK